jgi:L-lactate dehydrogenase complex protein LldE
MNEVQLFATCLAEEFFPEVETAATTVLERQGLKVRPIEGAFCCGQPAFNEGLRDDALELARRLLAACAPGTPLIVPSGSCTSMIRVFYRDLLADRPDLLARATAMRPWVYEFSEFLVDKLKVKRVGARFERTVTYHPSCHLMRELEVRTQPLTLLSAVDGIRVVELREREECCGFGGLFSVKFPHISAAMLEDKIARIRESAAEVVVSNDCGCLMQIGGGLSRAGAAIDTCHLAEILASR